MSQSKLFQKRGKQSEVKLARDEKFDREAAWMVAARARGLNIIELPDDSTGDKKFSNWLAEDERGQEVGSLWVNDKELGDMNEEEVNADSVPRIGVLFDTAEAYQNWKETDPFGKTVDDPAGSPTNDSGEEEQPIGEEVEVDNQQEWAEAVNKLWPEAKVITEDGSGKSYGELGDITAVIGEDMQADVVGTWSHDQNYGWYAKKGSLIKKADDSDPELHVPGYAVLRLSQIKKKISDYLAGAIEGVKRDDYNHVKYHVYGNGVLKALIETVLEYEKKNEVHR